MIEREEYRARAVECLRRAKESRNEADRRAWQMLAASYALLDKFRQDAEQNLDSAEIQIGRCNVI